MLTSRTLRQNSAMHLWLTRLAESLNDAGFSVNDNLVIKCDIGFTKENLKESVLKPVMTALYPEITSTTKLDTIQIQDVYLYVDRAISERTGVTVAWPTEEELDG